MRIRLESLLSNFRAQLMSGQIIRRIVAKEGEVGIKEVKILLPKAMVNGKVCHDLITTEKVVSEPDETRITKKGDVVIKLSTPFDAVIIDEEDEGLLITSFCAVIRGLDRMLAMYLISYFNSSTFNTIAKAQTTGSTVIVLALSFLRSLEISIPSEEKITEIAEEYDNLLKMKRLFDDVYSLTKRKLDLEFKKISGGN